MGRKGGRPKKETSGFSNNKPVVNNQNKPVGVENIKPVVNPQKKPKEESIESIEGKSIEGEKINAADERINKIIKYYESNIGTISPAAAAVLIDYLDSMDEALICKAIEKAVLANCKSVRYIQGILNKWIDKGFKTLVDAESENKKNTNEMEKWLDE